MGKTHTCDGDDSVELTDLSQPVSNRIVLQLTISIVEESERPTDVCYHVEDIPIGTRDVLRDHLAAACAHELHVTQPEWDTVTTYLSTIDKPRRRTNEQRSIKLENLVHRSLTVITLMLMRQCSALLSHSTW